MTTESSQYAAAAHAPLIKSPSLRVPPPATLPPDIHPLPDTLADYFVYPFTLEPHVITMESARRATIAAHAARREAYLKAREEDKERRRREALRRVAPGFEPNAQLVPTKMSGKPDAGGTSTGTSQAGHVRTRSVLDDLVDHLAALDASSKSDQPSPPPPLL